MNRDERVKALIPITPRPQIGEGALIIERAVRETLVIVVAPSAEQQVIEISPCRIERSKVALRTKAPRTARIVRAELLAAVAREQASDQNQAPGNRAAG